MLIIKLTNFFNIHELVYDVVWLKMDKIFYNNIMFGFKGMEGTEGKGSNFLKL